MGLRNDFHSLTFLFKKIVVAFSDLLQRTSSWKIKIPSTCQNLTDYKETNLSKVHIEQHRVLPKTHQFPPKKLEHNLTITLCLFMTDYKHVNQNKKKKLPTRYILLSLHIDQFQSCLNTQP